MAVGVTSHKTNAWSKSKMTLLAHFSPIFIFIPLENKIKFSSFLATRVRNLMHLQMCIFPLFGYHFQFTPQVLQRCSHMRKPNMSDFWIHDSLFQHVLNSVGVATFILTVSMYSLIFCTPNP